MLFDLQGKVALVTGASRGIGKGVALGLGENGATVYITGRSINNGELVDGLGGTIYETAEEVEKLGGKCIPIQCDHRNDDEVKKAFSRILEEQGKIDILVNAVWGGYQHMVEEKDGEWAYTWEKPFWEQPLWRWEAMFQSGVRAYYVASQMAAQTMVKQKHGLIVNISYWAAQKYVQNVAYGVAKAATDKMTKDMAVELKNYDVSSICIYPGLVRTENVMRFSNFFDMSNSESPQFIGRAVSALAADSNVIEDTGKILIAAELGIKYGFSDIDGRQPKPINLNEV